MEDIGDEVSLKIRSAIKAKLVELGAYVDDELPDYIMVMVANKRPKEQMDSDLNLFLGANTINFTVWLHTVLQKLQEVTILSKRSAIPAVEVDKPTIKSAKLSVDTSEGDEHKQSKHRSKSKKSKRKSSELKKRDKVTIEASVKVGSVVTANVDGDRPSTKGKDKAAKAKLKLDTEYILESAKSLSHPKTSSKLDLEKSLTSLESQFEVKKEPAEHLKETLPEVKVGEGSRVESSMPTRTISLMQSDDEDFEDIINIKDAGMKEFLDLELPEDLPKAMPTRTIRISPAQVHKGTPIVTTAVHETEMDVDDLEEQRANLLRDLKLLEKPVVSSRPVVSKYVPTQLLDTHVLKPTSILNRLGSHINLEPRLKIIDPDEFNIAGPPFETNAPKPRAIDRLGKIVVPSESYVSKKITSSAGDRSVMEIKQSSGSRTVPPMAEVKRLNVMERLGKRQRSDSDEEKSDARLPRPSSRERDRNVLSVLNDKKMPREAEKLQRNVLDRLGKPSAHRASAGGDRSASHRTSDQSDRFGRKEVDDRRDLERRRNVSPPEKRSSDEPFKARIMDRLGKKETAKTDRGKITDRLGKKVSEEETEGKGDGLKRPTRIISIKEALEGELKFSTGKKRAVEEKGTGDDTVARKRPVLSRVFAVKREEREKEEEALPDANMAVASVVRVKARPRVPASLQANKNLLLKAMAEAHKSVVAASAPIKQEMQPEVQRKDGFFVRKYRQTGPEKINITVSNPQQVEDDKDAIDPSSFSRKFQEIAPVKTDAVSNWIKLESNEQNKEAASGALFTRKFREAHSEKTDFLLNRITSDSNEPQNTAVSSNLFTRKFCEMGTENTSVTISNVKPDQGKQQTDATSSAGSLFTRKFRETQPEKINVTVLNKTAAAEKKEDAEMLSNNITRTFSNVQKHPKMAVTSATVERIDSAALREPPHEPSAKPRAVAALVEVSEGDDDEVLEEIYEDDLIFETSPDPSYRSIDDSRLGNVSPVNDDDEGAAVVAADEAEYVASKAAATERYNDQVPELKQSFDVRRLGARLASNTQFVVTLDGLDPTMFNARKRTAERQACGGDTEERPASPLPPVPEHERIQNWLLTLDRAKVDKEATATPVPHKKPRLASTVELVAKPKPPERCKYWPGCRQGDLCEFFHPITPCKTFPKCMYGDKCMYIHPSCKFATSCTRQQCPYAHGISRPVQAVLPTRLRTSHSQPVCKFYPKCSNVNCSFLHPMPCRFGRSCTNTECSFYHEELPSAEKLKWVKTKAF